MLEPNSYWARRMKRRRFLGTVGMGATTAAIAIACGGDKKDEGAGTTGPTGGAPAAGQQPAGTKATLGGTLTVAIARDATTFDPTRNQDVYGSTVLSLVAEQLYEVDKDVNTVPRVIERSENPEPNVYLWTLRRGIKFNDGSDVNAEAVRFNLQRHIDDARSVRNQDV